MSEATAHPFWDCDKDGLRVRLRLTPSGRRDAIDGVMTDVEGLGVLKASVTKVPEGGKANQALIKMLAKEWKVAKSAIEVVQGTTSRNKVLRVLGNAADLERSIIAWTKDKGLA